MAQEHTGQEHTGQDYSGGDGTEEARAAMADAARIATNEAQALANSGMRAMQETLQVARNGIAERAERTGRALHQAAEQLGGADDPMGGVIESAAARLDDVTRTLREGDLGSMVSDMESFARRQPAMFLAGAAVVGFAVARMAGSGRRNGEMMSTARERMEETGETIRERGQEARRNVEERISGSEDLEQGASSPLTTHQATGEPEVPTRTHPSQPKVANPERLGQGAQPQMTGRDENEPRPGE